MGEAFTRHSLRPLSSMRVSIRHHSGASARRDRQLTRVYRKHDVATFSAVIAREGGRSSTPRPIGSIMTSSGYWIARSSRAMTAVINAKAECIAELRRRCEQIAPAKGYLIIAGP
uniref:hypothetical protein n=1 Tax=Bradyrhizobium sp. (strain ORS 278) TaxID=114615 RepID=UPI0012FEA880|nr:hypothetical protein [Bradyrhizobium sp. ORS 278]